MALKKLLIAFLFLAACDQGQDANRQAARAPVGAGGTAQPPRLETLTGLYEGGGPGRLNQLCVAGDRFGLVIWGANDHSCSGSGTVTRQGEGRLRFSMAGDSQCTIEATISGKTVVFPQAAPDGCAYYCGARAQLGGASLTQRGTGPADALKAKDLVGEPLCGPEGE
jgi:hypothetical protein